MSEKKNLKMDILVIPTEKVQNIKNGLTFIDKKEILDLEKKSHYEIRWKMEEDLNFKQLLPYVVIKKGNKIFSYQRSKKGGEKRLFKKYSLGVGGHIDFPDKIISSTLREIQEELHLEISEENLNFIGLINSDKSEVDLHHIGIAIVIEVGEDFNKDLGELDKITNREFLNKEELGENFENFENWSKILYEEYLINIL